MTIFNLDAGSKSDVVLPDPVLAAAFGAGSQALIVTTKQFLLLDPGSGVTSVLPAPSSLDGKPLPVPFDTFPPDIIQASTGVSSDGHTIVILAQTDVADANHSAVLVYTVGQFQVGVLGIVATPPLGPRSVSVNQDGSRLMAGWTLMGPGPVLLAEHPLPSR